MNDQEKQAVVDALKGLDTAADGQWTGEGTPSLDAVRAASGLPKLSRQALTNVAPDMNRANHAEWVESLSAPPEPDTAAALAAAEAELAATEAQFAAIAKAREDLLKAVDDLKIKEAAENPPPHPSDVIKQHIESQHRERAERMGGQAVLAKILGDSGAALALASPVEQQKMTQKRTNASPQPDLPQTQQ